MLSRLLPLLPWSTRRRTITIDGQTLTLSQLTQSLHASLETFPASRTTSPTQAVVQYLREHSSQISRRLIDAWALSDFSGHSHTASSELPRFVQTQFQHAIREALCEHFPAGVPDLAWSFAFQYWAEVQWDALGRHCAQAFRGDAASN